MFYWIPPQKEAKFQEALATISDIYAKEYSYFANDMLITLGKNHTFMWDERFVNSFFNNTQNSQELSLIWRLHTLIWAAEQGQHVDGDFVECGVFKGFSSAVVCKYLDFQNLDRSFYLYDTFCGLPEQIASEFELKRSSSYKNADTEEFVRQRFSVYPNVKVIKGIVPHTFAQAVPEKIAYLHLDLNSANAEILALTELFHRMSPGAVLILDDFGWKAYRPQTEAEFEFMNKIGYKILELPTGQGLVIKR
jgi:hypothetical protein